jgi:hypothetical protein
MPSKKPGHEVRRGSTLVALGSKALLPLMDGHHGPEEPINLIGYNGQVCSPLTLQDIRTLAPPHHVVIGDPVPILSFTPYHKQ